TFMPAYLRYSGQFYTYASSSIRCALAAGHRVLILSGGYGLLLGDEPIGIYERRFRLSDWPSGLLEGCILEYAHHVGIGSVRSELLCLHISDTPASSTRTPLRRSGVLSLLATEC